MTVTVVIPTTGRSDLDRALTSVREQTLPADQVVIVLDDPRHLATVNELLTNEELIVTDGLGGGGARQKGVDAARSDYIAFLDDDDWWIPTKLEVQIDAMRNREASWSLSGAYFHTARGVLVVPKTPPLPGESIADYALERRTLRFGSTFVQTSTFIAERSLLASVPWDTQLRRHQDWDLALRFVAESAPVVYLPQPLVHVVQGSEGSVSKAGRWRESAEWINARAHALSPQAQADFTAAIVLRSAIRARSVQGVKWSWKYLSELGRLPHFPASIVGLSAILKSRRIKHD